MSHTNTNNQNINKMIQKTQQKIKFIKKIAILGFVFANTVAVADFQFLQAHEAAKRNDVASLQDMQFSMSQGLFAMYPEYWLLNAELGYQPASVVEKFTRDYWQTVMSEKLVADYVEKKAEQRDYQTVVDMSRYVTNADRSEACAIAIGKNGVGDSVGALALKHKVWLTVGKQPNLCEQLSEELVNNPAISQQDKVNRLRVLLRANQLDKAIPLAQSLGFTQIDYAQLDGIASSPEAYLSSAQITTEDDKLLFIYAVARSAESFVDKAANFVSQNANVLDDETYRYANRAIAMAAMGNIVAEGFHPQLLNWFDQSYGTTFSREEAEKYGRIAARFGSWQSVLRAVSVMDEEQKQERVWQYWFARASEQIGTDNGQKAAQSFYQTLAQKNDYYGLLAKDRLGQETPELPASYEPNQNDFDRMFNDAHFGRAFGLRNMNANASYARREWNWAVRQANLSNDDGMLLAAAKEAQNIGWYDRAIYAADKALDKKNYHVSYLTPYQDQVVFYSQQVGINPAWAYGIMRQESRFQTAARSHVGAGGLMQIMPATGRFIARKLGERYSKRKLTQMDTNIRWGTFYMSHILGELQYSPVLATAGYNAGPSRARRWQADYQSIPADQYIEGIPFNETRTYVKNVMTNTVHYALLFGQGNQSISRVMGEIPARI